MVVTTDPQSQQEIEACFRVDSLSQSLIGSSLVVNNLIQDCARDDRPGTILAIDETGADLTA